ncbi:MAG: T9SS type A sorting domain-containing protein [Bacteroidota bacterium]
MKKIFTLLLVVCCTVVRAQQITTAEYFFDTDPGIGNATAVTINSGAPDADINFSVNGLSAGLHIFNLRLKNSDNNWSTTYQSGVLIANGASGDATIVSAEYYFDTDPGFGNGIQLPVGKTSMDEIVNFDITSLTAGPHTIYVRLKNSVNEWGFLSQGSFIVSNGASGAAQIHTLEYFSENDLGVGKNSIIQFTAGAALDTTFSIPVPDNGSDSSVLGLRLVNNNGQMGNVALNTVSLCDLYKPQGGFQSTRYSSGYNFIDNSSFNPSKKIKWAVDGVVDTAYNNSAVYNYNFPSGVPGYKLMSQITGSGCRVDTSTQSIVMSGIESISPENGFLNHDYVMNIFGGGLDTNTVIYLQSGSSIIYPYNKTAYANKLLTLIFDLHTVTLPIPALYSYYDLHARLSSGYDTVMVGKVSITDLSYGPFDQGPCLIAGARRTTDHRPGCEQLIAGAQTFITTELTGSRTVKAGVWNYYTVNATNTSNVLAKCPVIWIMAPAENEIVFDVDYYIPDGFSSDNPLPTEWIPIDTVINGTRYQYKLYSFIPAYMAGGDTRSINFKMRSTSTGVQKVYCWAQKPQFGSPWQSYWNCVWDALGYVPYVSCFTSVYDWTSSKGGTSDFTDNPAHGHLYNAGAFFASYWYNTAGAIASCSGGKIVGQAYNKVAATMAKIENIESKLDKTLTTINNHAGFKNGCFDLDYIEDFIEAPIDYVFGFDPNHLTGNSNYDTAKHFINNLSPQHYEVAFENLAAATGNAQHVYVTDTLDKARFDFNTFRFTGYRVADSTYLVPPFRGTVYQTFNAPGRNDMKVLFVGNFDTLAGIIRSDFFSMNAAGTKVLADTSLDGFLPPNADGISGTGTVQFQVSAKDLNTLDTFKNVAHVYFDNNQPIQTNYWMNTVDITSPAGQIVKAERVDDTTMKMTMQKSDFGSGFAYNKLYGKTLSDSTYKFLGNFSSDTLLFVGDKDSTYQFYTIAVDNVGNLQVKGADADVTYTFSNALPVHLLSFSASKENAKVKLFWTSTNESNFANYVVERSADGLSFSSIGTAIAKGGPLNNNYQLYDEHPLAKANYYRLKQVDKDGSFTYSRIIRIDFDKAFTISVTPVPAHDYIIIDGAQNFSTVQLVDMSGRVVKQFSKPSVNTFNVADMPAGIYLVRLVSDNATETLKMVKQ